MRQEQGATGASLPLLADEGSGVRQWLPPRWPGRHGSSTPWALSTRPLLSPVGAPVACPGGRWLKRRPAVAIASQPCWALAHPTPKGRAPALPSALDRPSYCSSSPGAG